MYYSLVFLDEFFLIHTNRCTWGAGIKEGTVTALSNCYVVTVTEAIQIVSATWLPLLSHKNIVSPFRKQKKVPEAF
jgi:hypothetical protein